ncbi:MAG TPA: general secretion pathway protein GspF [Gammaproteobacteria bacterium]|nr:general secretion pathway protein GspF [Gammaproteobacteria bacterium]
MLPNTKIPRARTIEEYVDMVNQAIDETFDLRQSIEFDEEFMADARPLVDQIEATLKEMYESMKDGSYKFATGELPFIALMKQYHEQMVPFRFLLKRINETHMKGLDISDQD